MKRRDLVCIFSRGCCIFCLLLAVFSYILSQMQSPDFTPFFISTIGERAEVDLIGKWTLYSDQTSAMRGKIAASLPCREWAVEGYTLGAMCDRNLWSCRSSGEPAGAFVCVGKSLNKIILSHERLQDWVYL